MGLNSVFSEEHEHIPLCFGMQGRHAMALGGCTCCYTTFIPRKSKLVESASNRYMVVRSPYHVDLMSKKSCLLSNHVRNSISKKKRIRLSLLAASDLNAVIKTSLASMLLDCLCRCFLALTLFLWALKILLSSRQHNQLLHMHSPFYPQSEVNW